MEIMKIIIIILYSALLSLLFISCSSKQKESVDAASLYQSFYEMNKGNNFEGLYNLDILGIRDKVEFNPITNKYIYTPMCIGIRDSSGNIETCLPSFSKDADIEEMKKIFSRIRDTDSIYLINKYKENDPSVLFNSYVSDIKSIYSNYSKIKIPITLSQANIKISGCNDYIIFYLYENKENQLLYRCYYLKDTIASDGRKWLDFKGKVKIDSNWYHDRIAD